MDIFNKKKIKALEHTLWLQGTEIDVLRKTIEANKLPRVGDSLSEDSIIGKLCQFNEAIKSYLVIEIQWEWEKDPQYATPEPKMRRVWKAYKLNKGLKKHFD